MSPYLAGLGSQCTRLHRFNLANLGKLEIADNLQESGAVGNMAKAFVEAWRLYGNKRAVIMFFAKPGSSTVTDQRWLEYEIRDIDKSIPIIKGGFQDIIERAKLEDTCIAATRQEIFRNDVIEKLQKYFPDGDEAIKRIRDKFAGVYALDVGCDGSNNVRKALRNPDKYILRPRKLGGKDLFGDDIVRTLNEIDEDERRTGYILMDKTQPLVVNNYTVQSGKDSEMREMVNEVEIFGAVLSNAGNLLLSSTCGHIVKSKRVSRIESGSGVDNTVEYIDSPFLV
ncbi:glutathione synthetase-like [Saccoglossus kowalevskii]|uniref:Glutathione synthetase n=1 Tax=Saccoglossus kowalevskii TaxID=10224 RepID=A0ABM0MT38_SACKO|nr:PREDICTED: glutathione synthetase-like [Saccoglossus kowalevskii]